MTAHNAEYTHTQKKRRSWNFKNILDVPKRLNLRKRKCEEKQLMKLQ